METLSSPSLVDEINLDNPDSFRALTALDAEVVEQLVVWQRDKLDLSGVHTLDAATEEQLSAFVDRVIRR